VAAYKAGPAMQHAAARSNLRVLILIYLSGAMTSSIRVV
jgi:hypothetical protein